VALGVAVTASCYQEPLDVGTLGAMYAQPAEEVRILALRDGQTLGELLEGAVTYNEQASMLLALREHANPRRMREGTEVTLRFRQGNESLRGVDTGLFGRDRSVNVFVMGGGSGTKDSDGLIDHGGYWISGPSWPLPGTTFTEYHLRPAGALTTEPEGTTGSVSFAYDPDDPVLQIGGDYTYPFGLGPLDQVGQPRVLGSTDTMPLSARPDVLVFETEPLIEDVEVVGPIRVELYVSSDAPDTDFTAKLIDQYPPSVYYPGGYAMLLTDSIRRLRYRDSLEWTTPYTPGDVVAVEIDVRVTANVFKVGHRIRLDVSSSCFPSFDPNPNTGEPIGRHTHTRVANNTVHFSGSHRSRLILPIRNQEPPNKARGATDL